MTKPRFSLRSCLLICTFATVFTFAFGWLPLRWVRQKVDPPATELVGDWVDDFQLTYYADLTLRADGTFVSNENHGSDERSYQGRWRRLRRDKIEFNVTSTKEWWLIPPGGRGGTNKQTDVKFQCTWTIDPSGHLTIKNIDETDEFRFRSSFRRR